MTARGRHLLNFYERLWQESELNNENERVFRGKVSHVFRAMGIPMTYYTPILRQLEDQSCITFAEKGSRSFDSVIILHHPPDPESWIELPTTHALTDGSDYDKLEARVRGIEKLVGGINIVEALRELEERIENSKSTTTQGE